MIVYFADRKLNILGLASTNIGTGYSIVQDKKTENIENGVVTFDVTVFFDNEKRREIETYCEAGNYILRSSGGEAEFYTIIDEEIDSEEQTVTLYCEDAGMDLLNGIAGKFEATEAHPIAWYFDQWLKGTGFTIGVNEISSLSRKLKWDGESTITERLASVANQFDNAEISYTFQIDRLKVSAMHVNIYKKRGADTKVKLRVGVELEKINIKKSVADIATALKCTGGTPEGQENPITLAGYSFDDGDFYVSGDMVCCRSALKKWGRLGTNQHIVKTYSFDTTSQSELCAHAVTKLKEIKDTTFALTASIIKLPSGVGVGDRVIIVDEGEELYISTRLLTLGTSVTTGDKSATFGEFIAQDPGIAAQVQAIAEKISAIATSKADALAAAKAAEEARKKAEAAKSTADNATTAANAAKDTANAASTTANAAIKTANTANDTANTAKDTADAAASTASGAADTASVAKSTAEIASTKASDAEKTANDAKSVADTAQSTADAAKTSAETNAKDLAGYITKNTSALAELQTQIDGSIMTWFFACPPEDDKEPTSKWTTTDVKNQHLGDLYYDTDTGYCYRYQVEHQVYSWQRITDVDVTQALSDAKNAQDTADCKRRIFVVQPTPPYDVGDLWTAGATGDIKRCRLAKTSEQSYAASDWELASKYTDDTKANAAKSTADSANSKIDNMQIGGRNLLRNSNFASGGAFYSAGNRAAKFDSNAYADLTIPAPSDGNLLTNRFSNSTVTDQSFTDGKTPVSLSFDVRLPDGKTESILAFGWFGGLRVQEKITVTSTSWTRVKFEDVRATTIYVSFAIKSGDPVQITRIKLEIGTKCTDWTPAPEDVEATTDQLRDDLNSTESALNTQINEVSKKTDSTNSALNEARDELSKRIADTMAQAQMAAAAAKVAQTDLANYKSMTVDPQLKTMSDFMAKYNLSFRQDSTGLYITNQNADGTTADISLRLGNDRISFIQGTGDAAYEVAFISNNQLYITSGEFLKGLRLGNYALIPGANGNLSCKKVK